MKLLRHARSRLLIGPLAVGALVILPAAPALAHAELISSTPANGATLTKAPTSVVLTFGEPILSEGAGIVVTGPDGARYDESDTLKAGNTEASIELNPAKISGEYTIEYRIVAEDGHVGEGTLTYTLQHGGSIPSSQPTSTPDPTSSNGSGGVIWVLGLGAIGLVLIVAMIAVFTRGRRRG
jgi:copper resistance protein C